MRPPPAGSNLEVRPETNALYERVEPLAEVMFLVMSSDGSIATHERDALRGMLRSLTDGALSSREMEQMLDDFAAHLERDGIEQRLDTLAARLYAEPEDRELALALAAASAIADAEVVPSEAAVLNGLAERLGVSRTRVNELLEEGP